MEEPLYAALQREVQRQLGRCLIRLQQYELLLKEIVAKREVSGMLGVEPLLMAENVSAADNKTMGLLVGELTDKYFQPTLLEPEEVQPEAGSDDVERPAGWMRVQMSVSMPPDSHAQLKADLQELVDLRNDLVHHFVEGQDLESEVGCIAAEMYLQDCYEEIDRHLLSLQSSAESMNEAKRSMASFVASPEFKEFLIAELSPTSSLRDGALPMLIELLRRAEEGKGKDGWTALSAAKEFIKTVAPEEDPQRHSFRSWRQVLHDSRAFEVRRGPREPDGVVETWYRSKLDTKSV